MVHKLYLSVVVLCRVVAFGLVATSLSVVLMSFVFGGRGSFLATVMSTSLMLFPGIILWFASKPAARLITSGLRDEP